jgi:hypothetical protein
MTGEPSWKELILLQKGLELRKVRQVQKDKGHMFSLMCES